MKGARRTESAEAAEEKNDKADEQAVKAEVWLQGRGVGQDAFSVDPLRLETVVPADTREENASPRDDTAN